MKIVDTINLENDFRTGIRVLLCARLTSNRRQPGELVVFLQQLFSSPQWNRSIPAAKQEPTINQNLLPVPSDPALFHPLSSSRLTHTTNLAHTLTFAHSSTHLPRKTSLCCAHSGSALATSDNRMASNAWNTEYVAADSSSCPGFCCCRPRRRPSRCLTISASLPVAGRGP